MAIIAQNIAFPLNGRSALNIGGERISWSNSWIFGLDIWSDSAGPVRTATITLRGASWNVGTLIVSDAVRAVINDVSTGSNQRISTILLWSDANHNVTLTNTSTEYLRTGRGNDTIQTGANWISMINSFDGNDTVRIGAGGARTIDTGRGNDTVTSSTGGVDFIDLGDGNDHLTIGRGSVRAVAAGNGNDTVIANGNADLISTGDGNDLVRIAGDIGAVRTGNGNDTVVTGANWVDSIGTGNDNDRVTINAGGAGLVNTGEGNDTITAVGEVDFIQGGRGNDTIITRAQWVGVIDAGRGSDRVTLGPGGADYINLGRDADTLIVQRQADPDHRVTVQGGGNVSTAADRDEDHVTFAAFSAALTIDLESGRVDSAQGRFLLREVENITGGAGHDEILGNWEANRLIGGAGADTLDGGEAQDTLTGGAGADHFVFSEISHSTRARPDLITDFRRAQNDKIDLSDIEADGDQDLSFIGSRAFSGTAGELRSAISGGQTLIMADVNGDRVADLQIRLTGAITLAASDFLL